jgi:hypothetical protein
MRPHAMSYSGLFVVPNTWCSKNRFHPTRTFDTNVGEKVWVQLTARLWPFAVLMVSSLPNNGGSFGAVSSS